MNTTGNEVYPVYILKRTALEIMRFCEDTVPDEALAKLIGTRCVWDGKIYIKITDWVTGELEKDGTHATFTSKGLRDCALTLDERYKENLQSYELGLVHSHPFNREPFFSLTDISTFLSFPYGHPGNVFILVCPLSGYFKVFQIRGNKPHGIYLSLVDYVIYEP